MKIIFDWDIDFWQSHYSRIIEINQVLPLRDDHLGSIHKIEIDLGASMTGFFNGMFYKYEAYISDNEIVRKYHFEIKEVRTFKRQVKP